MSVSPRRVAGSEAAFQDQVLRLARLYGWRTYHTHDSRRSAPGFPDLVLVRPPRLIFAELKTASGRVSVAQQEWLDELGLVAAGIAADKFSCGTVEVYLWRPDDLQDIANLLAGNGIDPEIGRSFAAERSPGVRAVTPLVQPHRKGRA